MSSDPWDWTGGSYAPPINQGEAGPRAGLTLPDRRQGGPIIVRPRKSPGLFDPLPRGPWDTPPPPTSTAPRPTPDLVPDAVRRTLTAHGAGGVIPPIFGELPTGGSVIFGPYELNGFVYIDFLIGEGPIESVTALEATKTFAELGLVPGTHYNIHLGVTGDFTDALIQEYEPLYEIAYDNVARVSCKFPLPNSTTGNYNPLDFKCVVKGLLCTDPGTGLVAVTATKNPIHHLYESLINTRWGMADTIPANLLAKWTAAASLCNVDIDPSATVTKRWESCQKFDRDAPFSQSLEVLRAPCFAVLTYDEGWSVFVDAARAASGITLRDYDADTHEINCERFRVETAGVEEVPTVIFLDFTNSEDDYRDDWVQYPDPFPGGEWREQRFQVRGIQTRERARRWARQQFKKLQHDKRGQSEAIALGFKLEPGDRVGAVTKRLIASGAQDVQIVDVQDHGEEGIFPFAIEIYDPDDYDDAIDTTGPGPAPETPAPYTIPPAVITSLTFEGGLPVVWREIPAGLMDGTNDTFTLLFPVLDGEITELGDVQLYGGGKDYTRTGQVLVMKPHAIPTPTDDADENFRVTYNRGQDGSRFVDDDGNVYDAAGVLLEMGGPDTADYDDAYGFSAAGDIQQAGPAATYDAWPIGDLGSGGDQGYQGKSGFSQYTTSKLGVSPSGDRVFNLEIHNSGGGAEDDLTINIRRISDGAILATHTAQFITDWLTAHDDEYEYPANDEVSFDYHVSADPVDGSFWINMGATAGAVGFPLTVLPMWNVSRTNGSLLVTVEIQFADQFVKRVERLS